MDKLKYKDFTFPHNPRSIQVESQSRTAALLRPGIGGLAQNLGPACRVVRGEGAFYGSTAAEHCRRLQQLQAESSSGSLFIPSLAPMRAFFTKLTLLCEGDGSILVYQFEFTEEQAGDGGEGLVQPAFYS